MSRSIAAGLQDYIQTRSYMSGVPVRISRIDQGERLPYVALRVQDTDAHDCLDAHDSSLLSERFMVVAVAPTDKAAQDLLDALADEIDDYTGAMGTDRIARAVYVEDASGDFDPDEFGLESGRFSHAIQLLIQHSPAPAP